MLIFDPSKLLQLLVEAQVDFVVIGGVAATMQGGRLPTLDTDVMYERSSANLERLAAVLTALDVRLRGAEDVPIQVDARLLRAGDRFTFRTSLGDCDIFATADGAAPYDEIKQRAYVTRLGTLSVLVASLDDLIAMKQALGRPKDEPKLAELTELRALIEQE